MIGLAVCAVALGWLNLLLPLHLAVPLLAALAAAAALLIAWRSPQHRPLPPPREEAIGGLIMLLGFAMALAPLWGRPDLLSIGPNWDVEIYLPLAEYLKTSATGFSPADPAGLPLAGPPNPLLWRINFFDPRWAGMAFSQLQAAAGVLTGQEAHQNLAGVLALLYALSLGAAHLFFRGALGLRALPALAATGFLALNSAWLYPVFWSFGQQAAALPLLPLALAGGLIALERPSPRAIGFAGLGTAALLAAFIPSVLLYAVGMAGGLVALVVARRGSAAWAAAAVMAVSALLAPWAYLRGAVRLWHFADEGGTAGATLGPDVTQFPPLAWGLGLAPGTDGLPGWTSAVSLLVLLLCGLGVLRAFRDRSYGAAGAGIAVALLLLVLRLAVPYPYGYLKLLSSGAFLLPGFAALGAAALLALAQSMGGKDARGHTGGGHAGPPLRVGARISGGAAAIAFLGLVATTGLAAIRDARAASTMTYRPLEALTTAVSPGASVLVGSYPEPQGPKAAAVAYFLRRNDLYGYVRTGFSSLYRFRNDGRYDYVLFSDGAERLPEVLPAESLVWQGEGLRLFRAPEALIYLRDFGVPAPPVVERTGGTGKAAGLRLTEWRSDGSPAFDGWSPPLMGVLSDEAVPAPRYPVARPGTGLALDLPEEGGEATVALGSLEGARVALLAGGRQQRVELPPGVTLHTIAVRPGDGAVTVRVEGEGLVYVKSLAVWESGGAPPSSDLPAALVRWTAAQRSPEIELRLERAGGTGPAVLDVYSSDGQVHYGWWTLEDGGAAGQTVRLDAARRMLHQGREGRGPEGAGLDLRDGEYQAYLVLPASVSRRIPLFRFTLSGDGARLRDAGEWVFIG